MGCSQVMQLKASPGGGAEADPHHPALRPTLGGHRKGRRRGQGWFGPAPPGACVGSLPGGRPCPAEPLQAHPPGLDVIPALRSPHPSHGLPAWRAGHDPCPRWSRAQDQRVRATSPVSDPLPTAELGWAKTSARPPAGQPHCPSHPGSQPRLRRAAGPAGPWGRPSLELSRAAAVSAGRLWGFIPSPWVPTLGGGRSRQ